MCSVLVCGILVCGVLMMVCCFVVICRYVLKVEELLKSGLSDRDASQQAALYLRRQGVKLQIKKVSL